MRYELAVAVWRSAVLAAVFRAGTGFWEVGIRILHFGIRAAMVHLSRQIGLAGSGAGLIVFDGSFAGVAVFGFRDVLVHADGMERATTGLCHGGSARLCGAEIQ